MIKDIWSGDNVLLREMYSREYNTTNIIYNIGTTVAIGAATVAT